jgi:hypothetical protein
MNTKLDTLTTAVATAAHAVGAVWSPIWDPLRRISLAISVAGLVWITTTLATTATAYAQAGGGGGGGADISGAIDQAVTWLSGLMVGLGTLGVMASAVFWIISGPNSRRRESATSWMGACLAAVAIGFLAPSIIGLIQTWTGGGGGA